MFWSRKKSPEYGISVNAGFEKYECFFDPLHDYLRIIFSDFQKNRQEEADFRDGVLEYAISGEIPGIMPAIVDSQGEISPKLKAVFPRITSQLVEYIRDRRMEELGIGLRLEHNIKKIKQNNPEIN